MLQTKVGNASGASDSLLKLSDDEFELLLDCVRCGFCLVSCPVFTQTFDEVDSPRGRIHILRALAEGRVSVTQTLLNHLYSCLACRACQATCPSGVRYGFINDIARAKLERKGFGITKRNKLLRLLIRHVFPHRKRFELLVRFIEACRGVGLTSIAKRFENFSQGLRRWLQLEEMLPNTRVRRAFYDGRTAIKPKQKTRMRVGFHLGCASEVLLKDVNEASIKVLLELGCEVIIPEGQTCCGAIAMHTGFDEDAKWFAKRNIEAFERYDVDVIVSNAAGCSAALKEYAQWLNDDEAFRERAVKFSRLVRDWTEVVAQLPFREHMKPLQLRVTYDDPCHLLHAQGIREQPRKLIRAIPSIDFVELREAEMCCGGAGVHGMLFTELSTELLERKLKNIKETCAQVVVTANTGCKLQLQYGIKKQGLDVKVMHIAELIALSFGV
jgi:glycolate oxidase iron-sulfur subunit